MIDQYSLILREGLKRFVRAGGLILDIRQIPMDLYCVTMRSPLEVRLELRLGGSIPVSENRF